MIFHLADDDRLAGVLRQDAANIMMQFVAENFIAQIRSAVFGREDGMNQNLGEGLGHNAIMPKVGGRYNPFRVGNNCGFNPR